MSGVCFSQISRIAQVPAAAADGPLWTLTHEEMRVVRSIGCYIRQGTPGEEWRCGALRVDHALASLPEGTQVHRRDRTTDGGDTFHNTVAVMKTVVLKTTVGGHCMATVCRGEGCQRSGCLAHREMQAFEKIIKSGGSNVVCLPMLTQAFPFGGCILLPRLAHDLFEFITQDLGPIDEPMLADLACRLYRGLTHLHSIDVIHGDVKPDNIVVNIANGRLTSLQLIDLDQSVDLSKIPDYIDADQKDVWRSVCVEHTPQYVDPYPIIMQRHTPMIDGAEVRRVLKERDLWGLALTLAVTYCGHFLPAEPKETFKTPRTIERLVIQQPTVSQALLETDKAVECMKSFFDEVVQLRQGPLATWMRNLVFGVLETHVFDGSGLTASRRPFFDKGLSLRVSKQRADEC